MYWCLVLVLVVLVPCTGTSTLHLVLVLVELVSVWWEGRRIILLAKEIQLRRAVHHGSKVPPMVSLTFSSVLCGEPDGNWEKVSSFLVSSPQDNFRPQDNTKIIRAPKIRGGR